MILKKNLKINNKKLRKEKHMTLLEKIQYIEEKYKLYKYESWQYLRVVYTYAISVRRNSSNSNIIQKITLKDKIRKVFKTLFFGFKNWFRSYDYIIFDVNDDYKNLDGLFVSRLTEGISNNLDRKRILHIQTLWDKNVKPSKDYYVSDMIINVMGNIFYAILNIFNKKIKIDFDYEIINKELNLEINANKVFRKSILNKQIVKFILKIYKPKLVFVTCYTKRFMIIAAKELNIPVVEIQHGVIMNHIGYMGKYFNAKSQPDYLLVFGENDKKLLINNSNYIDKEENIIPVGSFMIEYILKKDNDIFEQYRKKFEKIVSISLDDLTLEHTINFIKNAARKLNNILFVLIPRNKDVNIRADNIIIIDRYSYSCLEAVKNSDFHLTVFSTCALESPSLGVPNIFWNYNNLSEEYFKEYIEKKDFNFLVNSEQGLIDLLKKDISFNRQELIESNKEYFMPNYEKNIKKFIEKIQRIYI